MSSSVSEDGMRVNGASRSAVAINITDSATRWIWYSPATISRIYWYVSSCVWVDVGGSYKSSSWICWVIRSCIISVCVCWAVSSVNIIWVWITWSIICAIARSVICAVWMVWCWIIYCWSIVICVIFSVETWICHCCGTHYYKC